MFGKQCLKLGSTALLLFAVLLAGGCANTTLYRATPEDTRDLSPAQARKLLIKTAKSDEWCSDPKRAVRVNDEKIVVTCPLDTKKRLGFVDPHSCDKWFFPGVCNLENDMAFGRELRFSGNPALVAILKGDPMDKPEGSACVNSSEGGNPCLYSWNGTSSHSNARDFVRAWYVLARAGAVDLALEAAFEREVQNYRDASVKPQLPEEAVRYKVKAESAVRQKRFDDAVDLYDQALGIAPWWPQGHYNRGLILGESGDFEGAVIELRRYLKLEPDAANARAVQLKIYEWEGTK